MVEGLGFMVEGLGFMVEGSGLDEGLGFRPLVSRLQGLELHL